MCVPPVAQNEALKEIRGVLVERINTRVFSQPYLAFGPCGCGVWQGVAEIIIILIMFVLAVNYSIFCH